MDSSVAAKPIDIPLQCLIAVLSFETIWAYYLQSDGAIRDNECRQVGKALASKITELFEFDEDYIHQVAKKIWAPVPVPSPLELLGSLRSWSLGMEKWPYDGHYYIAFLYLFLNAIKTLCVEQTSFEVNPYKTNSASGESFFECLYTPSSIRWGGHLPQFVLRQYSFLDLNSLIDEASATPSIAVVGDIRRSQDLMTYAVDKDSFAKQLIRFMDGMGQLVAQHGGILDKFTGDGFVAYFNEAVSKSQSKNYVDSFLEFIDRQSEFARPLFAEWSQEIRKMPPDDVGLALGADIGVISMQHTSGHFIAVGDAVVWATRMAAEAKADEVVINNALYHRLKDQPDFLFSVRTAETKTGEGFRARTMEKRKALLPKTM